MCFGKSDSSSSKKMVAMQEQEAAAARQKEAERQSRISSGLARIKAAFEGSPVMGTRKKSYTFSGVPQGTTSGAAVSGMPGFTYKQITTPGAAGGGGGSSGGTNATINNYRDRASGGGASGGATYSSTGGGRSPGGGSYSSTGGGGSTGGSSKWVIVGPDGKQYEVGDTGSWDESYDTGKTSGGAFDDAFYNKYKQGMVDYYMPQVQEKYGDAKDELTFRLARAGLLRSSMANTETTDLAKQNTLAEGKVRSDADKAAADLKARVASEKAKAESQLYATENPDVAANQALAAVTNLTSEKADTTPLGDIFSIAAIGGANALKGYSTEKYRQKVPGYQKSSSIVSS